MHVISATPQDHPPSDASAFFAAFLLSSLTCYAITPELPGWLAGLPAWIMAAATWWTFRTPDLLVSTRAAKGIPAALSEETAEDRRQFVAGALWGGFVGGLAGSSYPGLPGPSLAALALGVMTAAVLESFVRRRPPVHIYGFAAWLVASNVVFTLPWLRGVWP